MFDNFRSGAFRNTLCGITLLLAATTLQAQARNELGLSIGVLLPPDPGRVTTLYSAQPTRLSFGDGLSFEANYARRVLTRDRYALDVEVPLLAVPSESVQACPTAGVPGNFASLFVTPSLRVRLLPAHRLSPWGSIGGGYARYAESTGLANGAINPYARGTNTGALQYGVGFDYRLFTFLVPISLRAEARNLYSGNPSLNLQSTSHGHNDPFLTTGFVLHF